MRGKMFGKIRHTARRGAALFLSAVLLWTLLPLSAPRAEAAQSWMQPYLDKVVEWGIMRDDIEGNLYPDRDITRGEFVTMVNRAYGYNEPGENPFTDVLPEDWFYDDILTAYRIGYFAGTSPTTASPRSTLTREQAALILGRNMMLEERTGEVLGFTDSREISSWSRGIIESVTEAGIISGFPDGTFRPQENVTRGQVAIMLVAALGTPVHEPGTHTLGEVTGNVTVSTSGVTLKDTVIIGDLMLTGGLDLGNVQLDNVSVLGKIIVAGAGEGDKGDNSVILRNVTSEEMVVDSIRNQFVTIRAEGDTEINATSVRTNAYLEDVTDRGIGLKLIELDGEPGTDLQLAGSIEEVVNFTPESNLLLAQGVAQRITVDEAAMDSSMVIDDKARVKQVNLDVGADVSGRGDIAHLNVSADGSTVAMLPDTIDVRPGVTANIAGEVMDTVAAAESSEDPRLLAGYPAARKVAPTTAEAVFSTNKRGTVHWALSAMADGSVGEEDLITPPAYGTRIVQNGKIAVNASQTEVTAKLSSLAKDGAYYISALLEDSRGQLSPVKVTSFTTPDDTAPAFATGYPYMSKITHESAQVAVMPTKDCQLYYALMPKGSTAPTVQNFKAGALSGNVGSGSREATKNIIDLFTVNGQTLRELTDYDLYLCLIDADGGKDSGVKKLSFKTVDGTPPVFLTEPTATNIKATSVGLTASLNEAGTIFWVAVPANTEYPKPLAGQTTKPTLDSDVAKLQVANGMNIGSTGKAGKINATANRDVTINVTGLQNQQAYDLYYLARDQAGNYGLWVKVTTIHTLDETPPVVTQEFTKTADAEGTQPMPDTDVKIIFDEGVQDAAGKIFLELYTTANDPSRTDQERQEALNELTALLHKNIKLMDGDSFVEAEVPQKEEIDPDSASHWVDYSKVTVTADEGNTIFTFASGDDGAIKLNSGGSYYFRIADMADTSNNKNALRPNPLDMPEFTTVFAKLNLTDDGVDSYPQEEVEVTDPDTGAITTQMQDARIDMTFQLHPMSTGTVADSVCYDVFLWGDLSFEYKLYARVISDLESAVTNKDLDEMSMIGQTLNSADSNGWFYLGEDEITTNNNARVGRSINRLIHGGTGDPAFPKLNQLKEGYTYEFGIQITRIGTLEKFETWSDLIRIDVTIPAGPENELKSVATQIDENTWSEALAKNVASIGSPEDFYVSRRFQDTLVPSFSGIHPWFDPGDSFVTMHLQLDRAGTIYYVLAPVDAIPMTDSATNTTWTKWQPALGTTATENGKTVNVVPKVDLNNPGVAPPEDGSDPSALPTIATPSNLDVYQPRFEGRIKSGTVVMEAGGALKSPQMEDLEPLTTYFAYFVLKGTSQNLSPVYCYQFTTKNVDKPVITLTDRSPKVEFMTSTPADLDYLLMANTSNSVPGFLIREFSGANLAAAPAPGFEATPFVAADYDPAMDGNKDTFSVLDALLNKVKGNSGYSVFDVYAHATIRETVANFIRTGSAAGIANVADLGAIIGMKKDVPEDEDFAGQMTIGTRYYCLAVAHNTQGTVDSFAAIANVQVPDMVAPEVISVTASVTSHTVLSTGKEYNGRPKLDPDNPSTYTSYSYSGTLDIVFSKPVYFVSSNDPSARSVPVLLDSASALPDVADGSSVYFHNHISGAACTATKTTTEATTTFSLKFSKVETGQTITLFSDGWIANAGGYASQQLLILTFDPTMTTQDQDPDVILPIANPGFRYRWVSI